jgi:hypothetical protein
MSLAPVAAAGGVMKLFALIGVAAVAIGCGRSSPARTDTAAAPPASSSAAGTMGITPAQSNEVVALIGCLQGPAVPGATGTAGSAAGERARARASGGEPTSAAAHGGAAGRFVLRNARAESGGVGRNGAGASGGPLVSNWSEIELDGVPADVQASVNKQVRVTGRIDARPAGSGPSSPAPPGSSTGAQGAAGAAGAASAGSATGAASTRGDVRANSTTEAGDTTNRRLTVETVQVVAQSCDER